MTKFSYKARDKHGLMGTGSLEAKDARSVAQLLSAKGFTPVSISAEAPAAKGLTDFFANFAKVKTQEIVVFTRQLASVLEAGVPLVDGLEALEEQVANEKFRQVIAQVKKDIEAGQSFSGALDKHRQIFSNLVISMVRAGEKAGILEDVLNNVSNLLEKELATREKIKTATRYPVIVLVTLCIAFVILIVFVIPKFANFFTSFGATLPLPTRLLIMANDVLAGYGLWILAGLMVFTYGFRKLISTGKGKYQWDKFLLKVPIFGTLVAKTSISRFSRMLSAMLHSGIPILDALSISAATIENSLVSRAVLEIREKVSQGKSLHEPMKGNKLFPAIAVSMVAIGEKAGTLEQMLNKVSDYFDRETDYTIANLTPLLEPILIFGLAGFMLVFALAIFLPMWDMMKAVQGH